MAGLTQMGQRMGKGVVRAKQTVASGKLNAALVRGRAEPRSAGETAFLKWARKSLTPLSVLDAAEDDLASLGGMIGEATTVALSEAVHCGAEPLEFRNRLLEYLVREKGFTAIAIESGLIESRAVHDYVRGGAGDLARVLAQGLSWTFDQLPQNEALVRWLRSYNLRRGRARQVNFYGFDMAGSPGNNRANRGIDTALGEALRYLRRVDSTAAATFDAHLQSLIERLRFALRSSGDAPGYEALNQTERDGLTARIADLVTLFERHERRYAEASSAHDYAWAHRAALGARQIDAWLRQIPLGWQPIRGSAELRSEQISFFPDATGVRDRAQADNLDWIARQEGAGGKILVFAARFHLSAAPVKSSFWSTNGVEGEQEVAGAYLRRRLGAQLVTICNVVGESRTDVRPTLYRAPGNTIDGLAREVGVSRFVLDLRSAPPAVREWLGKEQSLADGSQILRLTLNEGFDVLFYIDAITPASRTTTVRRSS